MSWCVLFDSMPPRPRMNCAVLGFVHLRIFSRRSMRGVAILSAFCFVFEFSLRARSLQTNKSVAVKTTTMGVIINTPDPFGDEIMENILDNLIQENIDNNDNYSPRIKQRKCKNRAPVTPMDATTSRAGQIGNRRNRRNENANFLTTLAGNQDFGEVSIYDFMPQTMSAFAQVLKDNSSVWNNIINCSEEDEEAYLRQIEEECGAPDDKSRDERQIHPAFDAELCFERIENRFKNMFKKRHFPLGSLAFLEDQITSFFLEWPRSVYTSLLPNAFDRLMLHALCQYLDLHSESFTRRGARHTEVKNPRDDFSLPTSTLTSFLENRGSLTSH